MSVELIEVPVGAGIAAWFTTRAGGVSVGGYAGLNLGSSNGDDPAAVRENRRRLCRAVGLDPERLTIGHQVHGADVRTITAPSRPGRFTGGLQGWPSGDGLVTDRPGLGLAVLGADCLPVLIWQRDARRVGALHAGWRGLVAGVLGAGVQALGGPRGVAAAIGPGVGPCCYPVDAALRDTFGARFGSATVQGEAVDLAAAAAIELDACGVEVAWTSGRCTSCDDAFYSYRRDGERTGRHAGVIAVEAT